MMRRFLLIILAIFAVFALIQLIPIDRIKPPVDQNENFVHVMNTPQKIEGLIRNACYECHSNETNYPKYAYVAPVSWSVKHHITEGREHGNFSIWGTYGREAQETFLKRSAQTIQDRSMPLPGYMAQHPTANLTDAERKLLTNYFEELLLQLKKQ